MIARQFAVYVGMGLATALLDVGILELLLSVGAHYALATTVAFFVALVFNYISHSRVTFRSETTTRSVLRFTVILMMNYGITLAMVYISRQWLGSILVGKIASIPVVAVNGFLWSRYWIFR